MQISHIERKAMSKINPSWTKNVSSQYLNKKSQKFIFFFIILCSIILLIFAFFTFSKNVTVITQDIIKQQLFETTTNTKDVVESQLNDNLVNLNVIASAIPFGDLSDTSLLPILDRAGKTMNYHSVVVASIDGTGYCNNGSIINLSQQEYFIKASNGTSNISQITNSLETGKPTIAFSVPLHQNNRIVGVLSATMLVSDLEKSLGFSLHSDKNYEYIIRANGELILRSSNTPSNLSFTNVFSTMLNDKNFISFETNLQNGESNINLLQNQDNKQLYGAYAPLDEINDWYILSITPHDYVLKQTQSIIRLTYGLMLLLAFIFMFFIVYMIYINHSTKKTYEFLAFTDPLTGIRCWEKFAIDAQDVLKKSKDKKFAFIYTNILNFKYVNDILSFETGNQLLQHVADVLSNNLASDEPFTRVNADRFCFLLEFALDKSLIKRLEDINRQINSFKTDPCVTLKICNHYGIYKINDKSLQISTMGDRALLALQVIHEIKETNYSFYNSAIREKVLFEKELENDMQNALETNQFIIHLQPKFNLAQNSIIGAEALVRWQHPKKGLIPPLKFIKLFENNGFITKLDLYVFEETCKLLRKWMNQGKEPIPISVNLSRVHIYNPNIAEELYCTVLRYDIPPKLIEIELTESMDFDNITLLLGIVSRLKRFDFTISIDDFGTGYSSLNFLKNLPVDILKIDREFFSQATDENRGRQIIASVIDMAKRLKMKTVAEGVELKEQAEFLSTVNCDFVQGYLFSKPVSISDFEEKYILVN